VILDLLLTHGYFLYEDPKELQVMKPYVPLGILYLASHLQACGFDVEVFDTTFSSRRELLDVLDGEEPGVLGVYANLMTRASVLNVLKEAKQRSWTTVAGGPEPAAYIDEYLSAGADVVVVGEGEITMEELLPILGAGNRSRLGDVRGIAFRGPDGVVVRTAPRPQIRDIDRQPWPSRESVPIERYLDTWRRHHGAGSVSLITARGCPYDCRWCSHTVYGKTHRRRKPAGVVEELAWIRDRYSPDMLWIADDVFTIHHGWLAEFELEMNRRGIRIPFECISRADRINAEAADLLAKLGCFRIWIGSESGSQRVLDAMERGVTTGQVQAAVELCRARGIETGMFLMWGYEGEELEDIETTVRHVRATRPDAFLTTVAYPIRGTPYYDDVAGRVVSGEVWAQGSDRDLRIQGRHSRQYYSHADRLLRAEVELDRLAMSGDRDVPGRAEALRRAAAEARNALRCTSGETEA
jgi:radical SAM superfamily enzyme YgiQ (UPF0313 family)